MNTPASVNTRIKVRLIGFSRMGLFYLNKVLKARNIIIETDGNCLICPDKSKLRIKDEKVIIMKKVFYPLACFLAAGVLVS